MYAIIKQVKQPLNFFSQIHLIILVSLCDSRNVTFKTFKFPRRSEGGDGKNLLAGLKNKFYRVDLSTHFKSMVRNIRI